MATTSDPSPLQPVDISARAGGAWLRITASRFKDPLGWGTGESRFVPRGVTWGGIYLGQDIVTCFREAILRDRGLAASRPSLLELADLTENTCVQVTVPADFRVVDLISGPIGTLLDTDERSGRNSRAPASWAGEWRTDSLEPEGILYPSRFSGRPCLFIYDHALPKLSAQWRRRLSRLPDPHGGELVAYVERLKERSLVSPTLTASVASTRPIP